MPKSFRSKKKKKNSFLTQSVSISAMICTGNKIIKNCKMFKTPEGA